MVSSCGSDFDSVLTVYAGPCEALAPVACNDVNGPNCTGVDSSVRFPATAGVTYTLLAGGYGQAGGNLRLVASLVPVLTVAGTAGGNLTLNWSGNGTLQSATNLNPVIQWTDVTNGGGLWTEPMTNPAKFFRILK